MSAAAGGGAVLTALRTATAEDHQLLDGSLPFMREPYSREDYVRTLAAFYGFVSAWEDEVLPRAKRAGLDLAAQAPRLHADLVAVGADPAKVERVSSLPVLDADAAVYGSAYVLVGSRLGARVIGPWLMQHFGIDADTGCSYFGGEPEATGPAWRYFRERLEANVGQENAARAADAAHDTFVQFHTWLATQGVAQPREASNSRQAAIAS